VKHLTIAISILVLVAFMGQGQAAWVAVDSLPYHAYSGAALTYVPPYYIYAIFGNGQVYLRRYNQSTGYWDTYTPADGPGFYAGAALSNYDADRSGFYALQGGLTKGVYRYNVGTNSWTQLPDLPENVGEGGALAFAANQGGAAWLYAIPGHSDSTFYRYGPLYSPAMQQPGGQTAASWQTLAQLRTTQGIKERPGACLVWCPGATPAADSIFCIPVDDVYSTYTFGYSYVSGTWTRSSDIYGWAPGPGAALTANRNVNAESTWMLMGQTVTTNNKVEWRKGLALPWSTFPNNTGTFHQLMGASIVYSPAFSGYLYAIVGGGRRAFLINSPHPAAEGGDDGGQAAAVASLPFKDVRISPNPLSNITSVGFEIASPGRYTASIYDAGGRLVRSLLDGTLYRGAQTLSWDRSSDAGTQVQAGVYLLRLSGPNTGSCFKLIVR
jgi:hypothetical protein